MGDHLWPALYPGLIVGALVGLMLRGTGNVIAGMLGGVLGAWFSTEVVAALDVNNDLASLLALIVLSALGAFAMAAAFRLVYGTSRTKL